MSSNSTMPWSPPYYQKLNFSDCPAAGGFVADSFIAPNISSMKVDAILRFLRSLDPSHSTGKGPERWELLQWWDSQLQVEYLDTIYDLIDDASDFVLDQCDRRTFCNNIQLEGDPDLAGIGMMVSYYLVVTLATLYVMVLSLNSVKALREYHPWSKVHTIFEKTLNLFLDTSLLFSISMLLAAIYRFSSAFQHLSRDENTFMYSQLNAVTVSLFSVLPPLLLQLLERRLRRKIIRAILWFIVISFVTTLTVMYHQWRGYDPISKNFADHMFDMITKHITQAVWLSFCDLNNESLLDALDCAIIIAQVLLFLNLPCWIYLLFTILSAQKRGTRVPQRHMDNGLRRIFSGWEKTYRWVRALNIFVCCATMWLLLFIFTAIAVRLADAMGQWSKDRRWSVGQVLAMATFAPLIIDIIAIALSDPIRALEGKLPWSLKLVERTRSVGMTDVQELRRHTFHNTGNSSEYEILEDGARTQTH